MAVLLLHRFLAPGQHSHPLGLPPPNWLNRHLRRNTPFKSLNTSTSHLERDFDSLDNDLACYLVETMPLKTSQRKHVYW